MTRRGSGEGSIYQRGDGLWVASIALGYESGRRRRKVLYGRTRRDAQDKLRRAQLDLDAGGVLRPNERETVAAYLARWLDQSARAQLRPRTFTSYAVVVRRHLVPAFGRIPLTKLTPLQVQALVDAKAGQLSPQTVRNIHAVLRRALGQAVRWGLVSRNVAPLVTLPAKHRAEVLALSPADARRVLEAVRGDRLEPIIAVTLATGLRQAEALALRWDDVDLEAGTLSVRHALLRHRGQVRLVEPKTARSRRTLALAPSTVAILHAQRAAQLKDRLLAGHRWQEGRYVFTSTVGTPMMGGDVTKRFQGLLAASNLPRMRFHDLRHGAASLLLSQGVHPRVVMEILGHSTIALTMNVYSHVIPQLQREAAEKMEAALGG